MKSIKADIYNAVQDILKDSGLKTADIKAKIDIHKKLIDKAKITRKLADNNELLSDLSDEDIKNLKITLNSLVTLITYKRNEVIDVQNIEAWLKHTLKL